MIALEHRAAQYVRMSTDMQRYSIENQSAAIAIYAASRGLVIVDSYEDEGRSGVRMNGRTALQKLLSDVCSGKAGFRTILVYDVSRWGRFQDSDESAHYEFLCRQSGVDVEYCAEQFRNDGSLTAAVLKNIKRAMAGEFSRELSVKVFAGQSRLVARGYRVGAMAGYGFRRTLLDETGHPKMEMAFGQRKNLQSERVVLTLGPEAEIRTVQRIYDLFIDHRRTPAEVALTLNRDNVPAEHGHPWTRLRVMGVLSNEKYIGHLLYNRASKKLNGVWRSNPEADWIRCADAHPAIIPPARFDEARHRLRELARPRTGNDLLDLLTCLWCSKGHLTSALVDRSKTTPGAAVYAAHFGSLAKAFKLIGFRNRENIGRNAELRKRMIRGIIDNVAARGGQVEASPWNKQLIVNGEIRVGICISRLKNKGPRIWQFGYVSKTKPDIVVGARIADPGGPIVDYFVLPFLFLPHGSWITTSQSSGLRLERFRSTTLSPLYDLLARSTSEAPRW